MASGATETHLEVTVSESPGRRRRGKFQPFRRLFGKRKKRAAEKGFDAAEFKASFSTEEVCNGVVSDDEETDQHLRELTTVGSRALSHDSVFIPEEPVQEGSPEETMSQENISDKVRNLQRQIAQNIKFGQKPPSQRKSEGEEGSSDEEDAPRSPLQVLAQVEAEPGETEPKVQGAEQRHSTPVKSPRSKRILPATGTIESINLDSVPQSVPRLDNTAAKHKLAVKPKNQRVSRKHRRFTQELSLPDDLLEEKEATGASTDGRQRTPGSADEDYESLERSKKQRIQDQERRESRKKREREGERVREEALEEERKRRAEDLRIREEEEERCRRQQEEERLRKEEEDAERRRKEEEEMRMREEQERVQREEEERRIREEEERKREEEEERRREEEEQRKREEEESRQRLRLEEEERLREEREEAERQTLRELEAEMRLQEEEEEEQKRKCEGNPDERKRQAEELRWREMEERQRPFSFKVSSGEKQILFQKVNLTPVTPASGQQGGAVADLAEGGSKASSSPGGGDSPNLPTSQYVPHTAILVTGAQLCGPAVNLDQIKDPACKSLLGLGDDKKAMGAPKSKTSPERKSGKTKSLNESSLSTDQSSAAILAEWASIRSKIFKGAEEGKYEDYPEPGQSPIQNPPGSENQSPFPHTNLRKTMSASAKFSITPAKKKFSDSKRNSEVLSQEDKDGGKTEAASSDGSAAPPARQQTQGKVGKTVRIAHRSEGCMFAKDLPSFLVPNAAQGPADAERLEEEARSRGESYQSDEREDDEDRRQGGQDKPAPFGIKLRRTNYSLRFHSEQPTEKRKKRYSAGDSFDGVPSPLTPIEPESAPALCDAPGPASPLRESKPVHAAASTNEIRTRAGKAASSSVTPCEAESPSKPSSVYQRSGVSSKPAGAAPGPPPPLSKSGEASAKRPAAEAERERREESTAVAQLHRSSQGEEEPREKKSFFPSISIPWREKADRKTELSKREKPSLQSRHSLDSVRAQDKEAGPLWVTLALQKQKGFREQQQSREERRSHREAKLAEKQARDRDSSGLSSPSGSKGSGTSSPTLPLETPQEAKRPDSFLGRFERREHLKKANTLPSSVTVEIADSTPSPPAVKEVSKRFPACDSSQVCTEPAWLALAKRKAKAWSDCPQIIK